MLIIAQSDAEINGFYTQPHCIRFSAPTDVKKCCTEKESHFLIKWSTKTDRKMTALLPNCWTSVCSWVKSVSALCSVHSRQTIGDRRTSETCCSWPLSNDLASRTVRGSSFRFRISSVDDRSWAAAVLQSLMKFSNRYTVIHWPSATQ